MHGVNNWFKVFTCHHYQSSLFSKCDLQPIIRMSLKHCSIWCHWKGAVSFDCSYSCAQSLSVAETRISACALILCTIPGCQRKGQAYSQGYTHCGQKGSDGLGSSSAVRTGPRGPGPLLPRAPHSSRAGRLPTVQCFQFGGWMCCAPAEIVSWPVWWCCENGGTTFLIGA